MAMPNFDYQGALDAGYSEDEIKDFLAQHQHQQPQYKKTNQPGKFLENITNNASNFFGNLGNPTGRQEKEPSPLDRIDQKLLKHTPNFDVNAAIEAGYSPDEINDFLEENKPKKSKLEKGARIAGQYATGIAENAFLPYELGVAHLGSKDAQKVAYRQHLMENIEDLLQLKELSPNEWKPQDQTLLDDLVEQMKNPTKSEEFEQAHDIGVRGLAEKATGLDLHPEGILEKAANWTGFIKNTKNIASLVNSGITPKEVMKAIAPTGVHTLRGLGAGTALEMAEEGKFGPIGTMAAVLVGDIAGGGVGALAKGTKKFLTNPKQAMAEAASKFTPAAKKQLQKEIIEDFRKSGLQADLGTITDSNLVKFTQSRLAQSGLAGKALDEFRTELTDQIKNEYRKIADTLGEFKVSTNHEVGELVKEGMKRIRESDLAETRNFYTKATQSLTNTSFVAPHKLAEVVEKLEKQLKPGALKSTEQQKVLDTLSKLKGDFHDSEGHLIYARIKDLMNNKIAMNDIINYEVEGGAKQLLKGVVAELDRAIISHGKENPSFAKNYVLANKKFSTHAKTFRNKEIIRFLNTGDPAQVMSKMNSVHGIRNIENILKKTPEGKSILNNVKRLKLEQVIGDNLVNSTTKQVKLGTFSKLLEKGKNRALIKEILGPQAFKQLERLQKNAGRLAEAADKFYNASKSGAVATDAAILAKGMSDVASILYGNPWPLIKTVGAVFSARKLSSLMADPEFLKLVENVILSSEKGTEEQLIHSVELLRPYLLQGKEEINHVE